MTQMRHLNNNACCNVTTETIVIALLPHFFVNTLTHSHVGTVSRDSCVSGKHWTHWVIYGLPLLYVISPFLSWMIDNGQALILLNRTKPLTYVPSTVQSTHTQHQQNINMPQQNQDENVTTHLHLYGSHPAPHHGNLTSWSLCTC